MGGGIGQAVDIRTTDDGVLCIGDLRWVTKAPLHPELVPRPVFFDIPRSVTIDDYMLFLVTLLCVRCGFTNMI